MEENTDFEPLSIKDLEKLTGRDLSGLKKTVSKGKKEAGRTRVKPVVVQKPKKQIEEREVSLGGTKEQLYKEKMAKLGILSFEQLREMMLAQQEIEWDMDLTPDKDLSGIKHFSVYCRENGLFQVPNQEFVLALARHLEGKRVLEIGAGAGMLSAGLRACGIEITATDDQSWGEARRTTSFPVERLRYREALRKYRDKVDVVICSWMVREENWMPEILEADPKEIIAIGELYYRGVYGTGEIIEKDYDSWVEYPDRETRKLEEVSKYSICQNDTYANPHHSDVVIIEKTSG